MTGFTYYLEEGIEVVELSPQSHSRAGDGEPHYATMVLWLDVSDEPALSRICIAPRDIFELPVEYEDDRLANGEYA
jgi:hypothetical protein